VLLFIGLCGALAAVTADTWATELGVLATTSPRMITSGRAVPTGTSGAISSLGSAAALSGALFIALSAVFTALAAPYLARIVGLGLASPSFPMVTLVHVARLVGVVTAAGLFGSLFDSFLGATRQAIYFCDYCEKQTERQVHVCGNPARPVRGWAWLNNDRVNFAASAAAALVAGLLFALGGSS
jgi:uncharacterized membrane protein